MHSLERCSKGMASIIHIVLRIRVHALLFSILALALLTWLSLASLALAHTLLNIYDSFFNVDRGVVVSSQGFSPLTALISRAEVEKRLAGIKNITVEFYLVTPVVINNRVFLMRSSNVPEGCVFIGDSVARELRVGSSDHIFLSSVFKVEVLYAKVCGFVKGSWIEAPYSLVARIRGVSEGYYSLAVVKGSEEALKEVYRAFNVEEKVRLFNIVVSVLPRLANESRAKLYNSLTEAYAVNLGLYRDYALYLAYAIALSALLGTPLLGLHTSKSLADVVQVYRFVGVSRRLVVAVSMLIGLIIVGFSTILALILMHFANIFTISVLGFTLTPKPQVMHLAIVTPTLLLLYTGGVARGVLSEAE